MNILQHISDMATQAGPYSTWGQLIAGALVLMLMLYTFAPGHGLHPGIPAFGIDDKGWLRFEKARKGYTEHGKQLVDEAIQKVRNNQRKTPVSMRSLGLEWPILIWV